MKLVSAPRRIASAPARLRVAAKTTLPFYQSSEWRQLVASLIRQRGRRCEECGATGCRVYGDHVIEIRDGGARLDGRNVLLRCAKCHGRKTERRKRERAGLA